MGKSYANGGNMGDRRKVAVSHDTLCRLLREMHVVVCIMMDCDGDKRVCRRYVDTYNLLYRCATGMDMNGDIKHDVFTSKITRQEKAEVYGT